VILILRVKLAGTETFVTLRLLETGLNSLDRHDEYFRDFLAMKARIWRYNCVIGVSFPNFKLTKDALDFCFVHVFFSPGLFTMERL
jgi:hypothetical protein